MIIVNFKAYKGAIGENAVKLSEQCVKAGENTGEDVIVAAQPYDIPKLSGNVYAQHIDPIEPGSNTGSVLAEGLKNAGVSGTLLNHSEKRLNPKLIKSIVDKCKELELTTVVCAQTPEECGKLSKLDPDYIAFEPPELIGGDISVSEEEPEVIKEAVKASKKPVLTGAGIKTGKDVEKSIELGCKGVLVASGVVKAENTYEEILELCEGL